MRHVDALSRAPVWEAAQLIGDAFILNVMVSEDEISMYQRRDELLVQKNEILEKAESLRTRRKKGKFKDFVLWDRLLYKKYDKEKESHVVQWAMRKALVIKNHDLTSQFGVGKTVARIRKLHDFLKMRIYLRKNIASWVECLFTKHELERQAKELYPIPPRGKGGAFATVHLDHLEPFILAFRENKYIWAAICHLTKFRQLYAVRYTTTSFTIREIENFVQPVGAPGRFIPNRGTRESKWTSRTIERGNFSGSSSKSYWYWS